MTKSPSRFWRFVDVALIVGLVVVVIILAVTLKPLEKLGIRRTWPLPDTPISAQSDPQDVLALMINSHTTWQTADVRAIEMGRDPNTGQSYEANVHLRVSQPDMARLELYEGDSLSFLWIGDGESILRESPEHGVYTTEDIPRETRVALHNFKPPSPRDEAVTSHPLVALLPTRMAENLFPSGTAQNLMHGQGVVILGEEVVAGRNTVVVSLEQTNAGLAFKQQIYWVDAETGVILKLQVCGVGMSDTAEGYDCEWVGQVIVTEIVYGIELTDEFFALEPSADSQAVTPEEFEAMLSGS